MSKPPLDPPSRAARSKNANSKIASATRSYDTPEALNATYRDADDEEPARDNSSSDSANDRKKRVQSQTRNRDRAKSGQFTKNRMRSASSANIHQLADVLSPRGKKDEDDDEESHDPADLVAIESMEFSDTKEEKRPAENNSAFTMNQRKAQAFLKRKWPSRVEVSGILKVAVFRAEGLNAGAEVIPHLKVSLTPTPLYASKQTFKSKKSQETNAHNPEWGFCCTAVVVQDHKYVEIQIIDHTPIGINKIARAALPISKIAESNGAPRWLKLIDSKGRAAGRVLMMALWMPSLVIQVHKIRNVIRETFMANVRKFEPYVKLRIENQKYKTGNATGDGVQLRKFMDEIFYVNIDYHKTLGTGLPNAQDFTRIRDPGSVFDEEDTGHVDMAVELWEATVVGKVKLCSTVLSVEDVWALVGRGPKWYKLKHPKNKGNPGSYLAEVQLSVDMYGDDCDLDDEWDNFDFNEDEVDGNKSKKSVRKSDSEPSDVKSANSKGKRPQILRTISDVSNASGGDGKHPDEPDTPPATSSANRTTTSNPRQAPVGTRRQMRAQLRQQVNDQTRVPVKGAPLPASTVPIVRTTTATPARFASASRSPRQAGPAPTPAPAMARNPSISTSATRSTVSAPSQIKNQSQDSLKESGDLGSESSHNSKPLSKAERRAKAKEASMMNRVLNQQN